MHNWATVMHPFLFMHFDKMEVRRFSYSGEVFFRRKLTFQNVKVNFGDNES